MQALEADPARTRDRVLVVSGEDWHPGVIGIVAARLMERFSRPVIVISMHEGEGAAAGAHRTRSTCTVRSQTAHSI